MFRSWPDIVDDLQRNWYLYASMPLLAATVGYVTKIVAIKMMFRPREFKGLGRLGWQGIIPRRAPKMADILCDTLTGRLITAAEIAQRVDGRRVAEFVDRPLRREVDGLIRQIAAEYQPTLWTALPEVGRSYVVQQAQDIAPIVIARLMDDISADIDEYFDLKYAVRSVLSENADVLESMFLDVGRREFDFIRRSGLVFGFFIGIGQAAAWAATHNPLVMPLFGLFTGWFTDWAALRLIFRPQEPKKYLGVITWQGLFLKHRVQVSQEYGSLIATQVLTSHQLIDQLFRGPRAGALVPLFERHLERAMSEQSAGASSLLSSDLLRVIPLTRGIGGSERFGAMRRAAAEQLIAALPGLLTPMEPYADDVMQIRETMKEKMASLSVEEFEGVLRPAFQQDERTLIAVGATLGFLVGELQVLMVEHLSR